MVNIDGKITTFQVVKEEEEAKEDIPLKRGNELKGTTYKIKPSILESALYITINDYKGRPFEIFINSKDMQHFQWIAALTRVISAIFRTNKDIDFLIEELSSVMDPNGGYWYEGKYITSVVTHIGNIIKEHISDKSEQRTEYPSNTVICPKCREKALVKQDGCENCLACEYSKCG